MAFVEHPFPLSSPRIQTMLIGVSRLKLSLPYAPYGGSLGSLSLPGRRAAMTEMFEDQICSWLETD